MATSKKTYVYKVYEPLKDQTASQTVKGIWSDDVISEPSFSWCINGTPKELKVRLARDYDAFGEDVDVALNNDVHVVCYDNEANDGVTIYRGFISQYRSIIDGAEEYIDVILQGYGFQLANRFLANSDGDTTIIYSSKDPSDILRDVLDKFVDAGGGVGYKSFSNICANGEFETNSDGWWGWQSTVARSTDYAKSGSASLKCTLTETKGTAGYTQPIGGPTKGKSFKANAWVYAPASIVGDTIHIIIREDGGLTAWEDAYTSYTLLAGWNYLKTTKVFVENDRTSSQLQIYLPSSQVDDIFYVDSVEFFEGVDSIEDTDTTVTYTFALYSYKEVIDKIIQLCPEGWYWYVDPTNMLYLKSRAATVTHKLLVGRDVTRIEGIKDIEKVVNRVFFVGDLDTPIYRKYDRASSQSDYGIIAEKIVDHRVTLAATADIMAARLLDKEETPDLRMFLEIADSNGANTNLGYDIESLKVGDTIRLENLKQATGTLTKWDVAVWDTDAWDAALAYALAQSSQIMNITYTPNKAFIETNVGIPRISKRMEDVYRNLDNFQLASIGSKPTAG